MHGTKKKQHSKLTAEKKISKNRKYLVGVKDKIINKLKQLKVKKVSGKASGKSNDDDFEELDEWMEYKLELAEQAMEQFDELVATLAKLFEVDDLNPFNNKKNDGKQTAEVKAKGQKESVSLKDKIVNKMKEVKGSVKYIDNMIKSFGKLFA